MKGLQKLALVASIISVSSISHALDALEDDELKDISGQEGISIDQNYMNTIEEFQYIDTDGNAYDIIGTAGSGKIVITGDIIVDLSDPDAGTLTAPSGNNVTIPDFVAGSTPKQIGFTQGRQYSPQSKQFQSTPAVMSDLGDRIVR